MSSTGLRGSVIGRNWSVRSEPPRHLAVKDQTDCSARLESLTMESYELALVLAIALIGLVVISRRPD